MSKADQADAAEVLRLQEVLRQEHEDLAGFEDGGDDWVAQRRKVFAATKALLDFEARLPRLRDERRRKVSSVFVYVAAAAAMAVLLTVIVLMVLGRVSWWYLFAVIPVLAAAGLIAGSEPKEDTPGHRSRAVAAVLTAAAAGFVAVVTAKVLSAFSLLLLVPVLIAVVGFWVAGSDDSGEAQ